MGLGVKITEVTKKYQPTVAVDNVSLDIVGGELFGVIGPDGAGKTTLFRMIATLLVPDRGKITIGSHDIVSDYHVVRNFIGYMPGRFSLYQDLTVEENLNFYAAVFSTNVAANYHLIKDIYCMLEPFKHRLASRLSGGMKQKLALCCALIHNPSVLLLDEPTTGVDPVSRYEFWEILKLLATDGMTIIVSTPYMDEAHKCNRIAMMMEGHIIKADAPEAIIAGSNDKLLKVVADDLYGLSLAIRDYPGVVRCNSFGDSLHVVIKDPIDELKAYFIRKGVDNVTIDLINPTVEDCFIELVDNGR